VLRACPLRVRLVCRAPSIATTSSPRALTYKGHAPCLTANGSTFTTARDSTSWSATTRLSSDRRRETPTAACLIVDTGGWYKSVAPLRNSGKPRRAGSDLPASAAQRAAARRPARPSARLAAVGRRTLANSDDARPAVRRLGVSTGGRWYPLAGATSRSTGVNVQPNLRAHAAECRVGGHAHRDRGAGSQSSACGSDDASRDGVAGRGAAVSLWRDARRCRAASECSATGRPPQRVSAEALGRIGDARRPSLLAALSAPADRCSITSLHVRRYRTRRCRCTALG